MENHMSIFINTENAFDKIKYLLLIKNKTFNKMRINGYLELSLEKVRSPRQETENEKKEHLVKDRLRNACF